MIRPAGEWKSVAGTGMQAKRVRVTDVVGRQEQGEAPQDTIFIR